VLLVFEDVHWADPSSRESLDLLIERVATLRVLAIVTFRPEFTPPWIGRPHVTFVTLNRLPLRQRAEIIVHVTGGKGLPKEITDQIAERTDGVPLFIEELTKTVVESGMVADAMAAPFAIPTSLHASLLARLDRLASTREIAQIGAALGRSFSHELISAVAPMPQQQVDDALAQLVSAELIFCRGTPPDAEYTFKHALVRDAAYSTLLRSRRQQIHAQIAPTLENRFPESAVAQPELMAHHCSEAGLAEKAAAYWLRAGKLSVKRSAVAEAEAQLRRGLGALLGLPDGDDRRQLELELQIALGRAQMASRGFGSRDVGETYARARLLAEQLDRSGYISQLLYGSWVLHTVRGEHKTALSHAVQLEQIGWDRHDTALRLMGLCLQSGSRYHFGEFVAAIALAQQCDGLSDHRAIYAPQTADDMHTILLACVAVMLTVLGHIDQGRARMSDALSQAKQLGHKYTLAQVPNYYCRIDWMIDLPNEMERHAAESEAISIEQGFSYCSAVATYFRGFARAALDGPKDGLALLERGLSAMRATGTVVGTPTVMMMMAETYNRLGDSVESANCLLEAVRIIETTGERMVEAEVHRVWGDMLVASGDAAGAEQRYKRAVHVAQDQNAKLYELRTAKSLARLLRDQGRRTEAHDLLATVYNWFTEGFDTPVLKEAKALLDELAA
jgi:tetratricopeptide (TPR) repeat protein